jgi:hypothetical protein
MKNYIEEYFKNPDNVMNEYVLYWDAYEKVTPLQFFEWIEPEQKNSSIIFKRIICKDWFTMSVQASYWHYCEPRITRYSEHTFIYDSMEVWYPSERVEELMEYSANEEWVWEGVYGQVPVKLLNEIIEKHWGII